jgi:hypothetical protein
MRALTPAGWYPNPGGVGQRYWDGLLAVLVLMSVLAGCALPTTPQTARTSAPPAAIGTPVRDGKFEFVVTDTSVPEHWIGTPKPRGQWFIATMTVTNTGNEPQSFFAQNQKLIDSAGRTYAADSMAAMAMNPTDTTMVMDMNPGFSITVRVPFDVPPGTPVSAVEVHDSAFSGGTRVAIG